MERDLVMATLARCGGNRTWAADILGLNLAELRQRLLSYEVVEGEIGTPQPASRTDRYRAILEAYDPGVGLPS